jgi:glycosyltransferase involved in cell wall biosynthesis
MGISLVVTLKNEEASVLDFLTSIRAQTRSPDEVVIVDGGSTDRTADLVRSFPGLPIRCFVEPCNIARGRNIAIGRAHYDIIAVTDGGCRLRPDWLERITAFGPGTDVVAGNYRPFIRSLFDACQYSLSGLFRSDRDVRRFSISSRSIAFRRRVWEKLGGYPEFLDHSEDTYFHKRMLEDGYRVELARDAFVEWEQRPSLGAVYRQYFRYMRGDGLAGMNTRRHLIRFMAYAGGALLLALALWNPWFLVPLAHGMLAYLAVPFSAFARLGTHPLAGGCLVLIPLLLVVMDAGKMAGYLSGRWMALSHRARPASAVRPQVPLDERIDV